MCLTRHMFTIKCSLTEITFFAMKHIEHIKTPIERNLNSFLNGWMRNIPTIINGVLAIMQKKTYWIKKQQFKICLTNNHWNPTMVYFQFLCILVTKLCKLNYTWNQHQAYWLVNLSVNKPISFREQLSSFLKSKNMRGACQSGRFLRKTERVLSGFHD